MQMTYSMLKPVLDHVVFFHCCQLWPCLVYILRIFSHYIIAKLKNAQYMFTYQPVCVNMICVLYNMQRNLIL